MVHRAPGSGITLAPVEEADFATLRDLAGGIWRRHYGGMISTAQIEFMLAKRFSDEALLEQVHAADRWLELLSASGLAVGYCDHALATRPGAAEAGVKLAQLYVLQSHRHRGLGAFMLGHVEHHARELGRRAVFLQVNKRNTKAIGFYEARGFTIVEEAVFDIGAGFVMDDYVMEKRW